MGFIEQKKELEAKYILKKLNKTIFYAINKKKGLFWNKYNF